MHAVANQEPEVQEFSDLFDTTVLGKLPVVYHMRLDESVAPNVCAPRKVPIAMEKVMAELERMTTLGVIAPETEATEWVSAMVAAKKKDGSVRICIDPVHLNKALMRPHHPLKTIEQVIADVTPPTRVRTSSPSGSRTRDSGAGGGRSNKERQRLQPLASVARAPLFEVRRVRFTHSPYWHSYIRYTHPPKPHSRPGHSTNVPPRVHTATTRRSGSRTRDSGAEGERSNK